MGAVKPVQKWLFHIVLSYHPLIQEFEEDHTRGMPSIDERRKYEYRVLESHAVHQRVRRTSFPASNEANGDPPINCSSTSVQPCKHLKDHPDVRRLPVQKIKVICTMRDNPLRTDPSLVSLRLPLP